MIPLVLLPGMMCDARLFAPQIAALSPRLPVMHMPMTGHDTVEALAGDILAHAPPCFALAGLSMGGIVAMEVVRQASGRVDRLALLDTNPLAEKPEIQARRGPQIEAAVAGELARVMRDEMKPHYLTDGPKKNEILDLCMDMAVGLGPQVFADQSHALMQRPNQTDTLRAYDAPSLVLCGRDDALCPVHRHELMHQLLPQSTLTIVEEAGHLPTLEQPEMVTDALLAWLDPART
ncbi:MAG: alpha/beta fold hydrolase [Pseudomonadota bacterium]